MSSSTLQYLIKESMEESVTGWLLRCKTHLLPRGEEYLEWCKVCLKAGGGLYPFVNSNYDVPLKLYYQVSSERANRSESFNKLVCLPAEGTSIILLDNASSYLTTDEKRQSLQVGDNYLVKDAPLNTAIYLPERDKPTFQVVERQDFLVAEVFRLCREPSPVIETCFTIPEDLSLDGMIGAISTHSVLSLRMAPRTSHQKLCLWAPDKYGKDRLLHAGCEYQLIYNRQGIEVGVE